MTAATTTDAYLAGHNCGLNGWPYDVDEWRELDEIAGYLGDLEEAYDSGYRDGHFQKELEEVEDE